MCFNYLATSVSQDIVKWMWRSNSCETPLQTFQSRPSGQDVPQSSSSACSRNILGLWRIPTSTWTSLQVHGLHLRSQAKTLLPPSAQPPASTGWSPGQQTSCSPPQVTRSQNISLFHSKLPGQTFSGIWKIQSIRKPMFSMCSLYQYLAQPNPILVTTFESELVLCYFPNVLRLVLYRLADT